MKKTTKWILGITGGILVIGFLKPIIWIGLFGTGLWGLSKVWGKLTK